MQTRTIFGLLAAILCSLAFAAPTTAKEYTVGTVFNDLIPFKFRSGDLQVPLPPGDWKLIEKQEYASGGDAFAIPMARLFLLRHTDSFLTGAIRINLPMDLIDSHWRVSNTCAAKRKLIAWYVNDESFDRNENCSIVYPIRGFRRNSKNLKKLFEYVESRNLTGPNTWVFARFYRTRETDLLHVNYALPQEHYGFSRERKFLNSESPWSIDNIHGFPKKKAFMDKAVAWAASWQKLIDRGFANELRRDVVLVHPRIDGMAMPTTPAAPKPIIPANSAASPPQPAKQSPAQIAKLAPPPAARIADGPLSPEKLQTLISGKSAYGEGVQSNAEITFGRRGVIDGKTILGNTDYEDSGQWSVDETGRLCLKWNGEEFLSNTCYSATKRSNKILFKYSDDVTVFVVPL